MLSHEKLNLFHTTHHHHNNNFTSVNSGHEYYLRENNTNRNSNNTNNYRTTTTTSEETNERPSEEEIEEIEELRYDNPSNEYNDDIEPIRYSRNRGESSIDCFTTHLRVGGIPCIKSDSNIYHYRRKPRSQSLPNLKLMHTKSRKQHIIFPDISPRSLKIAEVKTWKLPTLPTNTYINTELQKENWDQFVLGIATVETDSVTSPSNKRDQEMIEKYKNTNQLSTPNNNEIKQITTTTSSSSSPAKILDDEIKKILEVDTIKNENSSLPSTSSTLTTTTSTLPHTKRPQLKLKLEDMPTTQEAEDRAQKAANRILARREGKMKPKDATTNANMPKLTHHDSLKIKLSSDSTNNDSDSNVLSPCSSDDGRHSGGSQWSPNHGRFITKTVSVSEAGISSPESAYLHLQDDLVRVSEIGRGASGVVYKAVHIPTLKIVAIKDVPVYGKGHRRQMVRELHALYSNLVPISENKNGKKKTANRNRGLSDDQKIQNRKMRRPSPSIVSFYDAFVDKPRNSVCLVMEHMGVGSLQDLVLRGGCQDERILSRMAYNVLQGLSHIHGNRMVHRDIKPHNLLLNRNAETKISDFGLARTLSETANKTKTFVGTLLYMAPERIGGGDYSYSADIWSFGLAFVAVAMGKYPLPTQDGFFGLVDSVSNDERLELPDERFSAECRDFVNQCLHVDPEKRPTASTLLFHPFITSHFSDDILPLWRTFVKEKGLGKPPEEEAEEIADVLHRHLYERALRISSIQSTSDYGTSFMQRIRARSTRSSQIPPIEKSLQLGLAQSLDMEPATLFAVFEYKRRVYTEKLLAELSFSPHSWTASPAYTDRIHLFRNDAESPHAPRYSVWRRLQEKVKHIKFRKKHSAEKKNKKPS